MTDPRPAPISYSIPDAANAIGVSVSTLRAAYRNGEIAVHYPSGGKPLVLHDDLVAWVRNAPTERRTA